MVQSLVEMSKDLVLAQIQAVQLTFEHLHQALHDTYEILLSLKTAEERNAIGGIMSTSVAAQTSLKS